MSRPQSRLGLDFITGLAMPPVQFVELAAELGCGGVTLALAPITANPHGYPAWSLRDDAALRRELKAALAATGIALRSGEVFLIRPGSEVADSAAELDLMAEIGIPKVTILSIEPDPARNAAELARFAALAQERGLGVMLEFMAGMAVGTLDTALTLIEAAGTPGVTLVIDTLHLARSGAGPAELTAIDPARIGYVQLCDALAGPPGAGYGSEALHNRLALGTGELPLTELAAAIPAGVAVGLELPMLARAQAGEGPVERLASSVAMAKALLGEV
jgi:sugar phosphate isomerase/epimerase